MTGQNIFQSHSMDARSLVPVKDQKEKPGLLIEVNFAVPCDFLALSTSILLV